VTAHHDVQEDRAFDWRGDLEQGVVVDERGIDTAVVVGVGVDDRVVARSRQECVDSVDEFCDHEAVLDLTRPAGLAHGRCSWWR
jgi:hypothetical protein